MGSEAHSFESQYPHIALWVNERGWIEIGPDEFSTSFVRALDEGGLVWEGNDRYVSLEDALRALDGPEVCRGPTTEEWDQRIADSRGKAASIRSGFGCNRLLVTSSVAFGVIQSRDEKLEWWDMSAERIGRNDPWQAPITYTNRKGRTYYLCQGVTKTGKPRYYFTQKPKDKVLERIPEGYRISESVNGRVSLVKDRPMQILPEEVSAIEAALQSHPKAQNYRVNVKHDRIEVYELVGRSAEDLIAALARQGLGSPELADRIRAEQEQYGQFTPVLRFVLADEAKRTFRVARASYVDEGWDDVFQVGSIDELARQGIPRLGSDEFFDWAYVPIEEKSEAGLLHELLATFRRVFR